MRSTTLTDAHGEVGGGLEAVGTDAAVASQRVDALARTAHTRVLQTLVTVCAGTGVQEETREEGKENGCYCVLSCSNQI